MAKEQGTKRLKEASGRIFEAQKDTAGKVSFPVVIISQGLGNLADRNYYTAEAIKQAAADKIYEGKKAYFDHPTPTQDEEQPGRSVRDVAGFYKNTKAVQDKDGFWVLRGDLIPIDTNEEAMGLLTHASEYKKSFPDKDFIGISINGDGEGKAMPYEEFVKAFAPSEMEMEKIRQVEGQEINAIMKLTAAVSADLVTEPGARGRILLESQKLKQKRRSTMKMFEFMKKFLTGAEKQDKSLMEEAVKGMLQSEDEDEAKKKEAAEAAAEAEESKHAESMAKAMLQAKKETKKYEGESEAEYEARCMKQAMKQMKKEAADAKEAADKAAAEAAGKEGKKEDFPPKKKDDDKDDGAEEKKKEGADDKHDDADQDKALIKKMMKQMDEMKKEIESMKQAKKESEDEAKKHHESAATAKIELEAKKRGDKVDKILRESGLPRYATDNLRELFLSKVRSDEEMKKLVETAKEVHTKALEAAFFRDSSTGFTEISTGEQPASNDHLFITKE